MPPGKTPETHLTEPMSADAVLNTSTRGRSNEGGGRSGRQAYTAFGVHELERKSPVNREDLAGLARSLVSVARGSANGGGGSSTHREPAATPTEDVMVVEDTSPNQGKNHRMAGSMAGNAKRRRHGETKRWTWLLQRPSRPPAREADEGAKKGGKERTRVDLRRHVTVGRQQ